MPFKFEAKYGLLTYAQSPTLDPFEIVRLFCDLGAECIVGREYHQDGGIHHHAFFMFERKFATRDVRKFDIGEYHPNIVPGYGTPERGWDYATKDGDIVAGGLERPSGKRNPTSADKWSIIVTAETRDEFFRLVQELDPRALACNFGNLEKYANWKYRVERDEYSHPRGISFNMEGKEEMTQWASENIVSKY